TGAHEVDGAINAEYAHMGYDTGPLGYPTCDETTTGSGNGRFNFFQNGIILWSPATGAHEVHGAINAEYARMGYDTGPYGYPTTDETSLGGGNGRFNHFQGGTIYWTPTTGTDDLILRDRALAAVEQSVAPGGTLN